MKTETLVAAVIACVGLSTLVGCVSAPNPSFPVSTREAKHDLKRMSDNPEPLERPLVILAGWGDPGVADKYVQKRLSPVFDDDRIIRISFGGAGTFDECRDRVITAIDEAFPSDDPAWTIEVDVVANSMGGLIARYASDPDGGERTVRIARLYTISTPFLGADMARIGGLQILRDMKPGSDFIQTLNSPDKPFDYEVIPYVRLGDQWIGEDNAAPPGMNPYWVSGQFMSPSHLFAYKDARILADIARRLREETPFTTPPATPLPYQDD